MKRRDADVYSSRAFGQTGPGLPETVMDEIVALVLAGSGAFLTAGFTFAAIRSRQTGRPYLLFWRSPMSRQSRNFLARSFFRGCYAEATRIVFFTFFTLIAFAIWLEG